jgi:hypothetical protein
MQQNITNDRADPNHVCFPPFLENPPSLYPLGPNLLNNMHGTLL